MIGNGGHAGESLEDPGRVAQRDRALEMGFAFAQTNTGHDSHQEPGASFVLSNPQKAIDYAYRAVHLTATTAKSIIAKYYGNAISHSYWNSCSNGGRQGLIEAQRYPEDFDGLVVNAPWVDQTGFTLGALWNQKMLSPVRLTAGKLALLSDKVLAKCDAIDGLSDGVIDDPRKCDFDPARDVPACGTGADDDSCLTAVQAQAIRAVYQGPHSGGKTLFPGYMQGSEALVSTPFGNGVPASAWLNFIVAAQPESNPRDFSLAENTMRYLVISPPDPNYDYRTFNFDRDPPLLERWGKLVNATETDLAKFRRRGGKLLMTYGWSDQVLQPLMGVNYYERAVKRNGPRTAEFFRLFMVPGMTHCSGGVGTDQFDAITAVIDWVEKNQSPDTLHASHVVDKKVVRTRPLCPYPQVARYQGQGSIDDASNFRCTAP
jgi:feruloyl esterase